jgi:hypothetical protein
LKTRIGASWRNGAPLQAGNLKTEKERLMRKFWMIGILGMIFLIPGIGMAQTLDAVWQIDGQSSFISIHEDNNVVVAVTFFPGTKGNVLLGSEQQNTAFLNFSTDASFFQATATLTGLSTMTLTVQQCVPLPGETCSFQPGGTITLTRVF